MRFWILLWLLGWRMRWLARHNGDFKNKLDGKNVVIQFRTADGRVARYYQVQQQAMRSVSGQHPQPTIGMTFKDAGFAFDVIVKTMKDKSAMMQAMGSRDIVLEGDAQEMMWLMSLFKYLPPRKKSQ